MLNYLQFVSRDEFRDWLKEHGVSSEGVWLLFEKSVDSKTITANEALEEALCFGWIDGQIKSLDDKSYVKYFSRRRKNSKWSKRNIAIVERLEKQGMMSDYGRAKIEEAKSSGQWNKPETPSITNEQIEVLSDVLKEYEPAYTNFCAMAPSIQKTYARAYYDAKTDATRANRISWMVERLNKNLKPM